MQSTKQSPLKEAYKKKRKDLEGAKECDSPGRVSDVGEVCNRLIGYLEESLNVVPERGTLILLWERWEEAVAAQRRQPRLKGAKFVLYGHAKSLRHVVGAEAQVLCDEYDMELFLNIGFPNESGISRASMRMVRKEILETL